MKNIILFKPTSLSQKILAAVFLISSTVTLMTTIAQVSFNYSQEMGILEKTLVLIEKSHAKSIAGSLWQLNEAHLQAGVDGILSTPGIQYVAVLDKNKTIVQAGSLVNAKTIKKIVELTYRDDEGTTINIGQLAVYGSVDQVRNKISKQIFNIFITQLIKSFIVSFLIYLTIQALVTKHLVFISGYLKSLNFNSRDEDLVIKRKAHFSQNDNSKDEKDELDILVESINRMREEIKQSYDKLHDLNKSLEERVDVKTKLVLEQRQILEYSSKMSALGEMAGGVAHEINNPITIINLNSRFLRRYFEKGMNDVTKFQKACDDIDKMVLRISKIILGLRIVSRDATIEKYAPCKIIDVFEEVMPLFKDKFKIQGMEIEIDLSHDNFQTVVSCRRVQLAQVFFSLLGNAYDAIKNLDDRWLKIESVKDDKNLTIRFIDSGLGIPKDIQEKIFRPFFTTKEIGQGTGLGLSLASSILKDHGGHLGLDEESGHTCFILVIPAVEEI